MRIGSTRCRRTDIHVTVCFLQHQNTLEALPFFITSSLIAGLSFPRLATGLGVTWLVGRVLYTIGYASGEPSKRGTGAIPSTLALLGLMVSSALSAYQLAAQSNFAL